LKPGIDVLVSVF